MLACYLALWKCGLPSNDEYPIPVMPAAEAITWIRQMRPGSIESASQEAFVGQWVKHRWQQKDKRVPEPQCEALEIIGNPKPHLDKSRVIVLVGASGSGKGSWKQHVQEKLERYMCDQSRYTGLKRGVPCQI